MQNPENLTFPTAMSELDLYRYFAAAADHGGHAFNFPAENSDFGGIIGGSNYCSSMSMSMSMSMSGSSCASFYPAASGILTETTESKAIAASRVLHKEAEKRRRERINSHLDRLRSLIPCTSKTDKATLLSKVVQRVAELKRQAAELPPLENLMIPSETDEFAVYIHNDDNNNQSLFDDGYCGNHAVKNNNNNNDNNNDNDDDNDDQMILKASLCCEDRPDLFADLSQVLSSLNLKTLRAEISTLGGRIQGVLVVSGDHNTCQRDECVVFLRDALKGIVQRSGSEDRLKRRRRVFDHPNC